MTAPVRRIVRRLAAAAARRLARARRIPGDEGAQAMTEYVIVIPVVLLMFFSAVQTMVIAQTVQLANYAAFAAARSYATEYAKFERIGGNPAVDAADRARLVACMVMAPVSTGVNDEIPDGFHTLRQAAEGNRDSMIMQGIMEGLTVAYVYRIKDFEVEGPSDPDDATAVIEVRFNYMLPIVLPGLNEMWTYLHRRRPGVAHMGLLEDVFSPNASASTPVADFADVLSGWKVPQDAGLADSLATEYETYANGRIGADTAGAAANLRIPAKCAIGFEPNFGQLL